MRVLVVIPCYNEEKNIISVIKDIKTYAPEADIVVVDDASTDKTVIVAKNKGAKVLKLPFNLGPGGALQTGFKYAISKNYDFIVRIDGDGQHDPRYIKNLLLPVIKGEVDMTIGSRFLGETRYKIPVFRKIGMSIFAWITSKILKQKITDTTSGFRAFNKKIACFFVNSYYPSDYPDADVLINLHLTGFRIKEIPVTMYGGNKTIHSGIMPLYYIFKMCLSILATLLRRI